MEAIESTGRGGRRTTAGNTDPLTLRLLRAVAAGGAPQEGPPQPGLQDTCGHRAPHLLDSITAMEVLSAWHRRGVEVGFPELMARPAPGRRRPPCSCHREHRTG
ncbi:hypothetical protein ABZS59_31890 [Streptomyces flaveolus]|uniref:hypothetical protein n=1 Tax=Streptomyces flaveolus TaxID=67297 RepID=UPI0033BF7B31